MALGRGVQHRPARQAGQAATRVGREPAGERDDDGGQVRVRATYLEAALGGGQAEPAGDEAQHVPLHLHGGRGVGVGGQLRIDTGRQDLAGDVPPGRGRVEQPEVAWVRRVHAPLPQHPHDLGQRVPRRRCGAGEVVAGQPVAELPGSRPGGRDGVRDCAPLLELAVPCEVFGRDRRDLAPDWYDLTLCSQHTGIAAGAVAARARRSGGPVRRGPRGGARLCRRLLPATGKAPGRAGRGARARCPDRRPVHRRLRPGRRRPARRPGGRHALDARRGTAQGSTSGSP